MMAEDILNRVKRGDVLQLNGTYYYYIKEVNYIVCLTSKESTMRVYTDKEFLEESMA